MLEVKGGRDFKWWSSAQYTYVPVSSPAGHTDDELDSEPTWSPQHAQQRKATSVAKKGKLKSVGPSKKDKKKVHVAVEPVDDSNVDVTPSPPPAKKRRTVAAKKKGKKKMTPAELVHYYSVKPRTCMLLIDHDYAKFMVLWYENYNSKQEV